MNKIPVLFLAAFAAATSLYGQSRVTPELIFIQGGTFTMGSPPNESGRYANEGPQRQVTISSFYLGKYELTQEEYQDVIGSNPGQHQGENLPLENLTWFEALVYCNERSRREGLTPAYDIDGESVTWNRAANGYRLPTEAEWEYAAGGGNRRDAFLYAGSNDADGAGWHSGNSGGMSHRVGMKAANALGLFDMSGNVGEMCWDFHGNYADAGQTNPQGVASGSYRVGRGGCWYYGAQYLRVAFRAHITPSARYGFVGFRLARNAN
ncbi:MAG: formylglycine-generating enzyme family protein [Planctomycetota bacterium]|jgi:formylglycine-generating enzyme required for sulfatase activity|nr:formylglycine-generating enzyme family protein [Planctomycetota bacterium]